MKSSNPARLDLPGSPVVIGDGAELSQLKPTYPLTHLLDSKLGE